MNLKIEGYDFAQYVVPKGGNLKKISKELGVPAKDLEFLNPQIIKIKPGMKLRYPERYPVG
jgi:LysM repeat protein